MDRIEQQNKFILDKYHNSEKLYTNTYTNESIFLFLNDFENMNVYPIYPDPIVQEIKKLDNNKLIDLIKVKFKKEDYVKFDYQINKLFNIYIKLEHKITEFKKFTIEDGKKFGNFKQEYKAQGKELGRIRKYFGYEINDYVKEEFNIPVLTTAWLKCYELITYFNIIDAKETNVYKSFHICEIPGTFILAINHFIKTKTKRKFDWNAMSLNPWKTKDKTTYLPDQYNMVKENQKRYDFGPKNTGDITDIDNIKYYINKNKDLNLNLITSDCGQDSSDDFVRQEEKLNLVFWSQFVCTLGCLGKGGDYIAKIFTIKTKKTIEMLYILSCLFEKVYIVKPLKTKPTSGERYIVCTNYKGIDVEILDILIEYLKVFNEYESLVDLTKLSAEFYNNLKSINDLLGYRRITGYNASMFQSLNFINYINENKDIYSYNKKMVDYYVQYFAQRYNIEKIKN
jgi:cap2 methyltransferase